MRFPFLLIMIWSDKRQDTNVEKIYASEQSKQTSNNCAFIHITFYTYNYEWLYIRVLMKSISNWKWV